MAAELSSELTALIASGPLAHLSTLNADGSPQVTVIWIGFDDGQLTSSHLGHYRKVANIERDPRVVLSFLGPRDFSTPGSPYTTLRAHATVEPSERAWDVLDAFAKIYMGSDVQFPAPKRDGFLVRYAVERVSGVGPWAAH